MDKGCTKNRFDWKKMLQTENAIVNVGPMSVELD